MKISANQTIQNIENWKEKLRSDLYVLNAFTHINLNKQLISLVIIKQPGLIFDKMKN